MALASGMAAQLGLVAETTYGTPVTVSRFYPIVNESLGQELTRMDSQGIVAGARNLYSLQWATGLAKISGDVGMELWHQQTALLFSHMLGSITSSATAGVATHTCTPGDLTGKSLTVQVGRPDVAGVVHPFTYAGVKVQAWELKVETGENVTLGLSLLGQSETTGIALATASFGTDASRPFTYTVGGVTIAGGAACVRSLTLEGNNALADDRECIGSALIKEPLEAGLRDYTGTATLEFEGLTQYNRFVAGTETAMVLSLSASTSARATVAMNARFDGVTPAVADRGLIITDVPFRLIGTQAITATIVNSQTVP